MPAAGPTPSGAEEFDAIVIGSGIGGLSTAAYLTANGMRTLVLEQYDTVGGCSHVFRRHSKFEFDVGLHYVGDCGPGGVVPTVLSGVGLGDKVSFLEMDPDGFDTLLFPDFEFRVPKGWDRYLERLIEACPGDEPGLRRAVEVMSAIPEELEGRDEANGGSPWGPTTIEWGLRTLNDLFDACELSAKARGILAGESIDHAAPPSRAAIALHAGLMDHYIRGGAWYPEGGAQVLAAHLIDVIHSHGGRVRTRARVDRILVEGGRVAGVEIRGGERIAASVVVSNADIKRTYLELLEPGVLPPEARERAEGYRMALPLFCVYLGLDIDLSERMPNTNYWCHADLDSEPYHELCYRGELPEDLHPEEAFAYLTSASVKDPHSGHSAPEGHSTLELITLAPPQYSYWEIEQGPAAGEKYSKRGAYRDKKERLADTLIARAAQVIDGLEDHIVFREAATPITQERYTLSSGGACYGLEFSPDQVGPNRPRPETEIEGLYLAGASIMWAHGIMGSMRGGVATAGSILGRDVFEEAKAGHVFADTDLLTAGGEGWDPLMASKRLSKKPRSRAAVAR